MTVERVGIVVPDLGGGGVQRVLANLAGGLADRGVDVTLFTLEDRPTVTPVPTGVRHVVLGGAGRWAAVARLRATAKRERLDALVGGITRANLAVLAAARGPTRSVLTKHLPVDMLSPSRARVRVLSAVIRHGYARADAVVAVSRGTYDSLLQIGLPPVRVHRIANPVLGPGFDVRCAAAIADPWFAVGAPPVVVGVGRLVPQKDFATLVRAVELLRDRSAARLVLFGEGPERGALEHQVARAGLQDRVRFAGHVPDPLPYLARASVFVSTSRWEGLPTALIEALAAGASVVATDCRTGPREILEDGALGELVPVGDAEASAAAIERALSRPGGAPRESLKRYRVDVAVDAYLAVLGGT